MSLGFRRILQTLLGLTSAAAIALFCYVGLRRMAYPFELEWMEGGILAHVQRVLAGESVYTAPSLLWTAFIYNPLYYFVAAAAARVTGEGLFALRLVSFLSTLGCLALLYRLAERQTRSPIAGLLAAGFFAATFERSGGWFDVARIDSLALLLSLAAMTSMVGLLQRKSEPPAPLSLSALAVSGGLLSLAFLTKQSALILLPALAWSAYSARRLKGLLAFGVGSLALVGPSLAYLHWKSAGWYWYYALELPLAHSSNGREALRIDFWQWELCAPQTFMAALALFGGVLLLASPRAREGRPDARALYVGSATLLIVESYITRLHMGSFLNDLMPMHAALALLGGLGFSSLCNLASRGYSKAWVTSATLLALAQFALLAYDPVRFLPPAGSTAAGNTLVRGLKKFNGDVLVFYHPHLTWLAGKRPHAHAMALVEIMYPARDPRGARELLKASVETAVREKTFEHLVVDEANFLVFTPELRRHYYTRGEYFRRAPDVLYPTTGMHTRPTIWMSLIPEPRAGQVASLR